MYNSEQALNNIDNNKHNHNEDDEHQKIIFYRLNIEQDDQEDNRPLYSRINSNTYKDHHSYTGSSFYSSLCSTQSTVHFQYKAKKRKAIIKSIVY